MPHENLDAPAWLLAPDRGRPHWKSVRNALLATILTSTATDTPVAEASTESLDRETKVIRAKALIDALEGHIGRLRPWVRSHPATGNLLRALADGDDERLRSLGLDIGRAWLDDIALALVMRAPAMEIETVGPYAAHHVHGEGRLDVAFDRLPGDEQAGILLAAILRDVTQECPNVRIVALLDELNDELAGRAFSDSERDRYVADISRILYHCGVLRPDDRPGRDIVLLRESAADEYVDTLVDRLRVSGKGTVGVTDSGDVIFVPTSAFVQQLGFESASRNRELRRKGIVIRRAGRATCQALDAAGFLRNHELNARILHVVMLDKQFDSQQDKTYALLRAVGIVRQDTHHNVFYDADALPPQAIALAVCQLLVNELKRLIVLFGQYDEWDAFGAEEYRDRWYGERVVDHDRDAIEWAVDQLMDMDLPTVRAAADVGPGPSLVPSLLMAPFVDDEGSIRLIEYAESNRDVLRAELDGLTTDIDDSIWRKFERVMAERSPRHAGALERLPALCHVEKGSVFALPTDAFELVTAFFLTESITTSRREFRLATRALLHSLRPGGIAVIAHMVRSLGYPAGDARFPAVHLTREDLEETYRDAEVDFRLHLAGDSADDPRDGYEGVAIVVARRVAS